VLLALIAIGARACRHFSHPGRRTVAPESLVEGEYHVVRVVDGDTIIVAPSDQLHAAEPMVFPPGKEIQARVRLMGIDTPETVKRNHPVERWGEEATAFTEQFVAGKIVQLRFDRRRVDQYDRFLAYVYVDQRCLNEELVRAGLARVSTFPGDSASMARRLQSARDEAEAARRGIWSDERPPGD